VEAETRSLGRILASGVIVLVLFLQAIAALGLTPGPIEKTPFLWPFLDYPMYSTPHYEGDAIPRYRVVGTTADGREMQIDPETLGADFWIFRNAFLFPFRFRADRGELEPGVELFERRHGVTLVEVRLEDRPIVLSRSGSSQGPVELVGTARRAPDGDSWEWEVP